MSINSPSDLVLDATKAADPQAMRAAMERLRSVAADRAAAQAPLSGESFAHLQAGRVSSEGVQSNTPVSNPAFKKFEAVMLQSFIESMFTGENQAVYGEGIAGGYWKSMMSEALANQMADAGGIGIARMLEEQSAKRIKNEVAQPLGTTSPISTKEQG